MTIVWSVVPISSQRNYCTHIYDGYEYESTNLVWQLNGITAVDISGCRIYLHFLSINPMGDSWFWNPYRQTVGPQLFTVLLTACASSCFVRIWYQSINRYHSGLLYWQCNNPTIASVPIKRRGKWLNQPHVSNRSCLHNRNIKQRHVPQMNYIVYNISIGVPYTWWNYGCLSSSWRCMSRGR